MIVITIVLLSLFMSLYSNLKGTFEITEIDIAKGVTVCINTATVDEIEKILQDYHYTKNDSDTHFVAQTLYNKIKKAGPINSLSDLRKTDYRATVQEVEDGNSQTFRLLYQQICQDLEQSDSTFLCETQAGSDVLINPEHRGEISVKVWARTDSASWFQRVLKLNRIPCPNVYVRLNEHVFENSKEKVKTIAYIRTDEEGKGIFKGLDEDKSYSVLPIALGYKFGNAKGTIHSNLRNSKETFFEFEQSTITIPLFPMATIKQIKADNSFIVRTPSEFKNSFSTSFFGIILFWWCLIIIMKIFRRSVDTFLTSALLGLTGLSCIVMYSLNNPLTDSLLGEETSSGIMIGCLLVFLLQFVNIVNYYQDKSFVRFDSFQQLLIWLCEPYKQKVAPLVRGLKHRNIFIRISCLLVIILSIPLLLFNIIPDKIVNKMDAMSKGTGYLLFAILITLLLFTPLGSEVGGMKVNLNIGVKFQPSEIAKYLFVIFMAAFFCQNADKIIALDIDSRLFGIKVKNLVALLVGFLFLMILYVVLQDLGPAMVIIFTFIILYSIIKSKDKTLKNVTWKEIFSSDFAVLCIGVISFLVFIYLGNMISAPGIACVAWFVLWIGISLSRYKKIHETSVLFNLVIAAFIFGGYLRQIPVESLNKIGDRLESRSAMSTNTWGNMGIDTPVQEATTNSQVADGLWGLATGGWGGQGLSHGECTLIPAFNTDMILESIGAQLGFVGLVFILLLYFVLFRRSLVIGYRSNHPFTFYLCVGIAIVTGVQLAIIALGSTGVIPLTGITVPLLSYGKVSIILNLFAFGLVLSVSSHVKKESTPMATVMQYNNSMALLTYSFVTVLFIIGSTFFYYQWIDRDATLIRPVFAKNNMGVATIAYNPRISAIVEKMRIGDIYDRNGVLLATSNREELNKYVQTYSDCGLQPDTLDNQKRYYPFGEHLFFMVGDLNTKLFFNGFNRGLLAEREYLDSLRGYDNILKDKYGKKRYVEIAPTEIPISRFLEDKILSDSIGKTALRDYSALIPYLKAGVNSERVEDFNKSDESFFALGKIKPADINLSVDAVLQTKLQNRIQEFVSTDDVLRNRKKVRVSAVVLDASSGEVLSSANYPMPNIENLLAIGDTRYSDKKISEAYTDMDLGLFYHTPPGSTAKVMSALSSFMKYGSDGANFTYPIRYYEKPSEGAADVFNHVRDRNHVTMDEAITWSSNIYFIKLVNENDLYGEMGQIYAHLGIHINGSAPYYLKYQEASSSWNNTYRDVTNGATTFYRGLVHSGGQNRLVGHKAFWLTWGQNPMTATPFAMAKVAAVVGNNGFLLEPSFLKGERTDTLLHIHDDGVDPLARFMRHEASVHTSATIRDYNAGGKTGTVVRDGINDAWYICFCDKTSGEGKIAIALRIERARVGSTKAKQMVRDVVLRTLDEMGYISKS